MCSLAPAYNGIVGGKVLAAIAIYTRIIFCVRLGVDLCTLTPQIYEGTSQTQRIVISRFIAEAAKKMQG